MFRRTDAYDCSVVRPADHPVDFDPLETGSLPVGARDVGQPVIWIMGIT
jgi:hypothetical protein